jgi:hypothetical protein
VTCQRQHWASHKRQCRVLAEIEYVSTFRHRSRTERNTILQDPDPSELSLLLKLSAIAWTIRSKLGHVHVISLNTRGLLLERGRPAPGDTKEGLIRLLKRALTELPWPELPGGTDEEFSSYLEALSHFGESDAAVEILNRRVEDVERHVKAPYYLAQYYFCRLHWLLVASSMKTRVDRKVTVGYEAEAKGLMERATRSLRGLQSQDWDNRVSESHRPGSSRTGCV